MNPNKVWVFSDLLEKNKRVFKVPVYQRNYDWSNIECGKLYDDIIVAHQRDHKHFAGTIVYIVDRTNSSLDEALIIDGQQRLTTMYIFLKAIYDLSIGKSPRIESEIQEVMFNRNCDETNKIKLKPIKSDNTQLLLLIQNKTDDMDRNSNIYKNYIFFKNRINDSIENGYELNDILDGIKKLEMVEIVLDKSQGDEPQKIFESINSTGLELSLADLIRNYLLMDDDDQDNLYENYWLVIEKNVGYSNLGDFVINYLNSKITASVKEKNAYRLFKEHCIKNNLSHETVLKDLYRTSKYYGAFIGINDYYNKNISSCLNAIYSIKQTTILPLLFKIFDDYEEKSIDSKTLCKVLDYLLTYLVRITACEINKNLSKFFKSMYDRVIAVGNHDDYYERFVTFLNDLRSSDRMPTDKEFKDALKFKPLYKKPICKFVLATIENSTKEHISISELTIEHILPQKENAAVWKAEVGKDYNRVYELYLHTLGNLTITGHNSELGTKPFAEKKRIIRENSKANVLNKTVLSADVWNEDSILRRADELSDILIEAFDYVDIHSDAIASTETTYNVDDAIDWSGTDPVGFTFIGEYTKVSDWANLLTKFISLVYDLESDIVVELAKKDFVIPNASNPYITNDSRKLRRARQINESGIYYEVNLSACNIVSFIKAILLEVKMETDDLSFTLGDMPFSVYDRNTWGKGKTKVAQLFYYLVEDLIKKHLLSASEVEEMKDKSVTKGLFNDTDYPAFANNHTDNMGKSSQKRYRKKPISFNGTDLYVSTQFFESDRDAIIEWYDQHL